MTCWRSRAIGSSTDQSPRLVLWPRRILYLGFGLAVLVVASKLDLTWWAAVLLCLPLALAEGVARFVLIWRLPSFEREVLRLLQAGETEADMLSFFRRQRFLHFAAPRQVMQAQLALILATRGRHSLAAAAYREALEGRSPAAHYPLAIGLADSLFLAGEHAEAERAYRQVIDDDHINGRACARLSQLIVERGGDAEEAERYLRLAISASGGGPLRRDLALLLQRQGRFEEAQGELDLAGRELAGGTEYSSPEVRDQGEAKKEAP